jgi:hypothetical protein
MVLAAGSVVRSGELRNMSGTLTNNGWLDLTAHCTNGGTVNGNGRYALNGDWTNSGTFTPGTSTVEFRGSGNQTIAGMPYHDLVLSTGGTRTLAGSASLTGNLTISNCTVDLGGFSADRVSSGGSLSVSNGSTLTIGGTGTFPSNFSTHALGSTSTVEYYGTNQTVAVLNTAQSYGVLVIRGSGIKSVAGSVATAGNCTVNLPATLSIGVGALLQVGGHLTNNGTLAGNGTVTIGQ